MSKLTITQELVSNYVYHLQKEERSRGTIEKYARDVNAFAAWLGGRDLCKENAAPWKEYLLSLNYAPVTVNSMLAAVNGFFRFVGCEDCKLKFLKVQRRTFREKTKELTRNEYTRLIDTADKLGKKRTALVMETICSSGIRVSELKYITVEAARTGRADVSLKGKIRTILIPGKLCRKLLKYAQKQSIKSGEIFRTGSGSSLSRGQIWAEMKKLCSAAGVESSKVFPHNLRHLFATVFHKSCRDIVKLADVLGHSSIETTRIYLITSGTEHQRQLERLGLVQ